MNRDVCFWLCWAGCLLNCALAVFGTVPEMGGVFGMNAGCFFLGAVCFWESVEE